MMWAEFLRISIADIKLWRVESLIRGPKIGLQKYGFLLTFACNMTKNVRNEKAIMVLLGFVPVIVDGDGGR